MRQGQFYTERDIIDMVRAGVRSLSLVEDDRITDVARERALKEGMHLDRPPSEAAKRPEYHVPGGKGSSARPTATGAGSDRADVETRVKAAVVARLGDAVDPRLVQDIVHRVLDQLGVH